MIDNNFVNELTDLVCTINKQSIKQTKDFDLLQCNGFKKYMVPPYCMLYSKLYLVTSDASLYVD